MRHVLTYFPSFWQPFGPMPDICLLRNAAFLQWDLINHGKTTYRTHSSTCGGDSCSGLVPHRQQCVELGGPALALSSLSFLFGVSRGCGRYSARERDLTELRERGGARAACLSRFDGFRQTDSRQSSAVDSFLHISLISVLTIERRRRRTYTSTGKN